MRESKDIRKEAFQKLGALPPNPRGLPLWGQNDWITMYALERRVGQRRGAAPAAPEKSDPPVRNLLRPKNGLDNGVHLTSRPSAPI